MATLAAAVALEEPTEESTLVRDAKRGSRVAFSRLFHMYRTQLYRFACRRTRNEEVAKDVVQQTFVKTFETIHKVRNDKSLRSYLYRIAERRCIDYWRKNKRMDASQPEEITEATPQTAALGNERAKQLRAALKDLPEKQRMAIELRTFEDLSFREVADVMGGSEGTARVNYHHGLKKLKAVLVEDDHE